MRDARPQPAPCAGAMPAGPVRAAATEPGPALRLGRDEKGNFLVFFGMSVAVLFGMVALSFDLGRMAAVQTDLQSFADSVALSAAAELDGQADSIARACAAAALVSDSQSFASGGRDLTMADLDLVFLKSLPADDAFADASGAVVATVADPNATNCAAVAETAQRDAVLVRVNVDPHDVEMNFASVVSVMTGGSMIQGSPSATATAGFTQYACDIAPLMFCLPQDEDGSVGLTVGQMLHLRQGGNSAAWGPGNFGFLDVSDAYADTGGACKDENGADRIRCLLGATETVTRCYSVRGVSTDPGQSVGINVDPFNFRFDVFEDTGGGFSAASREDPDFAPAPNVIYGQEPEVKVKVSGANTPALDGEPDQCSPLWDGTPDANNSNVHYVESTMGLPPGPFQTEPGRERFGDGDRTFAPGTPDRIAYMALNHNWTDPTDDPFPNAMTRWDVYRAEIAAAEAVGPNAPLLPPMRDSGALVPLQTAATTTNGVTTPPQPVPLRDAQGRPVDAEGNLIPEGSPLVYHNARFETGRPQCAPAASDDEYRRAMVAAAIDCTRNEINGKKSGITVETFYELFLTNPVSGTAGDLDIFGEVIGIAGGTGSASTSNGVFRDVVQLYR